MILTSRRLNKHSTIKTNHKVTMMKSINYSLNNQRFVLIQQLTIDLKYSDITLSIKEKDHNELIFEELIDNKSTTT